MSAADIRERALPKWAQRELDNLRCEVISLRKACNDIGADAKVALVSWTDYLVAAALPDRAQVTFLVGSSKIEVRLDSNHVGLRVSSSRDVLRIEPAASNVVYIHTVTP